MCFVERNLEGVGGKRLIMNPKNSPKTLIKKFPFRHLIIVETLEPKD